VGAPVKAGCDPARVLEHAEHALNQIALLVGFGVEGGRCFALLASRNALRDVQFGQGLAPPR